MGNFDFDAWSAATDGETSNGSLDSRVDGVRVLRWGTVRFGLGKSRKYFLTHTIIKNWGKWFLYNSCVIFIRSGLIQLWQPYCNQSNEVSLRLHHLVYILQLDAYLFFPHGDTFDSHFNANTQNKFTIQFHRQYCKATTDKKRSKN